MDVQLPIMDGYTATRRIKVDPALRSIPIIAVREAKVAKAAGLSPTAHANYWRKIRQHLS
jgi:CheY-like chemotaxis protein